MLLVSLPTASATITGSTFEADDGDLATGTGSRDWANVTPFHFGIDLPTGKRDDSFKGGVDEDTVDPALGSGAIPNSKDDLARFYLSFERAASGDELLYLAWIRNKTSGSADMDFELNQAATTTSDGLPTRTAGDLLVTYEFIATKTPEIRIQRWITTGSGCVAAAAPPCWANRVLLDSTNSEAEVNDGYAVPDPGRYLTPNRATTLPSQTFGEAAINLTSLRVFTSGSCIKFARAFAKSRSSQSFNASMQDLIRPVPIDFSNCVTKSFDITVANGVPAGATLYGVFTTPDGVKHSVALAPGTTAGHVVGSDGTVPPGAQITDVHLELRTASGGVAWRNAGQTETIGESTTNTGTFGYGLALSPPSAENFVGRPHPLTATAVGTGSLNGTAQTTAALVGLPVGFRLESGTPSGCGTLTPTSDLTDGAGRADTVLTSSGPCSTTIRAFIDKAGSTQGYDAGDVAAGATKTFVAYHLGIAPASATNALGEDHTFVITLTRDTGSGPAGYAGQTVSLALGNATATGAHLVTVNGTAASGTSGSCTTTSTGTCTVVATATRTGTFSLDASYTTTDATGQGTFDGSGTKSYVDYRVQVTPASATNEVGVPHTFTVTLERDTGAGFAGLAGQTVDLVLSTTAGNVHYSSIDGTPTSGTGAETCTTGASGTCLVTVTATTPGLATLAASYSTVLDSGPFTTQPASGTKQYSAFRLTATPLTAINQLGEPHTFTVTLTRDDGSGPAGLAGEGVGLSLDAGATDGRLTAINAGPASGTTGSCVTRSDGTCAVTIVSSLPGTAVLTATWDKELSEAPVRLTAQATKRYLDLTIAKSACAAAVPPGGLIRFDIPWSASGATLRHARIVDDLPAGLTFVSASPAPSSAPAPGSSGQVVWTLADPLPDGASGTVSLVVQVAQGTWTNTGWFQADEGVLTTFSSTVSTSTAGAAASGEAYGLDVQALGQHPVVTTPRVTSGASQLQSLGIPPQLVSVLSGRVGLLDVSNAPSVGPAGAPTTAADEAVATVADVDLLVAGVPVKAKAVQARSDSLATGSFAGTGTTGSQVVGLQVGGAAPIDVSSPTVLPVVTVGSGATAVQVRVAALEATGAVGAAQGGAAGAQPQGGLFSSGLTVNGLHVTATAGGTVLADVIVSSARSLASFPTLTPCAGTGPYLVGQAYVAKQDLTSPIVTVGLPVGLVTLPAAGGSVTRTLTTADLSALGATAGTGETSTVGTRTGPVVDSDAKVQRLKATLGAAATLIDATLVRAHASVGSPTASGAEIAKLSIAGLDVCGALAALPFPPPTGPGSVCYPRPNTVLLDASRLLKVVLNEQVTSGGVVTVNAVHVYALGAGNALGLPVGADLVLSSATAGAGS